MEALPEKTREYTWESRHPPVNDLLPVELHVRILISIFGRCDLLCRDYTLSVRTLIYKTVTTVSSLCAYQNVVYNKSVRAQRKCSII